MKTDSTIARAYRIARRGRRGGGLIPATQAAAVARGMVETQARLAAHYAAISDAPDSTPAQVAEARAKAAHAGIYGGATLWGPFFREAGDGLRYVGAVVPDCGGRNGRFQSGREKHGFYCNPWGESWGRDGDGLAWGVVYQLPARRGVARYVAGYQFGGVDGGPTLDLSTVYTIENEESAEDGGFHSGAAAAADSMAKAAAEKESEYQAAWRAGCDYAEAAEAVKDARAEALRILKERRAVGAVEAPALCEAIRRAVVDARARIAAGREAMAEAVESVWPGESNESAFLDGAGLDAMPGAAT